MDEAIQPLRLSGVARGVFVTTVAGYRGRHAGYQVSFMLEDWKAAQDRPPTLAPSPAIRMFVDDCPPDFDGEAVSVTGVVLADGSIDGRDLVITQTGARFLGVDRAARGRQRFIAIVVWMAGILLLCWILSLL